jgi:hypothetical protein
MAQQSIFFKEIETLEREYNVEMKCVYNEKKFRSFS